MGLWMGWSIDGWIGGLDGIRWMDGLDVMVGWVYEFMDGLDWWVGGWVYRWIDG